MPDLHVDGVRLSYRLFGRGRPVLMLHGAAASYKANFGDFGWSEALVQQGFQVIGLDQRGHGESDRPRDPEAYGSAVFARDALCLLDHLGLQQASVVGYSLGARVTTELLTRHAHRLTRVALVAIGDGVLGQEGHTVGEIMARVRDAVSRTEYPRDLPRHLSRYWHLANATGADLAALVALTHGYYPAVAIPLLRQAEVPTLIVSGSKDQVAGGATHLANALPQAKHVIVDGADHFTLAAFESVRSAVGAFLAGGELAAGGSGAVP